MSSARTKTESEYKPFPSEIPLIWPEWSDADLNNEKWAFPKNGPDGLFLDPQPVRMPEYLPASKWIRAKDLTDLSEPLTVFASEDHDLIPSNQQLLHHEFVRSFISAITNLENCGRSGLEISCEGVNFNWSKWKQQPWYGWMNVYSLNKAGKDAQHQPVVNPNGKYIVRLFFMGSWRRITVDDMVPVDSEGKLLLPRTKRNSELWPVLLIKGILKLNTRFNDSQIITYLTGEPLESTVQDDSLAFETLFISFCKYNNYMLCSHYNIKDSLSSLFYGAENAGFIEYIEYSSNTGWTCLTLNVKHLSLQDKWDFLINYAEHFEWQSDTKYNEDPEDQTSNANIPRQEKVKLEEKSETLKFPSKPTPVTLFLHLEHNKQLRLEAATDWGHFVYVAQCRDIPLDPRDMKPPLARWKMYRWLRWAIDEGIIDPKEYFTPIRYLKMVSPLRSSKDDASSIFSRSNYQDALSQANKANTTEGTNSRKEKIDGSSNSQSSISEMLRMSSNDDILSDSIVWADFNKLGTRITELHLYYKPEYFGYAAGINTISVPSSNIERKLVKDDRKSSRRTVSVKETLTDESAFVKTYFWPREKSLSRHEPLYLYCDSVEEKFVLIDFSIFHPNTGNVEDSRTEDYLIVGKHSWFQEEIDSETVALISTDSTNSTVIELAAGRHLLRFLSSCKSFCFVRICSNTVFHVGDRLKMYKLMVAESERIERIARDVSESAIVAYQAFGRENYRQALSAYHKCYMPPAERLTSKQDKMLSKDLHRIFMEEQVRAVMQTFPEDLARNIIHSLRIFFIDPTIGTSCPKTKEEQGNVKQIRSSKDHVMFALDEIEMPEILDICEFYDKDFAAMRIQSFFKTLLIKKYKEIHNPNHNEHKFVVENLEKLISLFQYNNRESIAHQLLRDILRKDERLCELYPYSTDLENVLNVQEFKGSLINIKPGQWFPIVRVEMNAPTNATVFASINLSADLPRHSVRVFRNSDYKEMPRIINNVSPSHYRHEVFGYTVLAYGWSEENRINQVDWVLTIATRKGEPSFQKLDNTGPLSSDTKLPRLAIQELSGLYIPNKKKCISKWILRCSKRSLVSFRLKASYDSVKMRLKVVDEESCPLVQVQGCSSIVLPLVCLDPENINRKKAWLEKKDSSAGGNSERTSTSKEQVYYVVAEVLNDSWPLTESEWATVLDVKCRTNLSKRKLSASSVKTSKPESAKGRRSSRYSFQSALHPDAPYWTLQVVIDADSGVEIVEDRRKQKKLAELKESWWKENSDNFKRGKDLREAFISENAVKSSISESVLSKQSPRTSLSESYSTNREIKEVRSNQPPQSSGRRVPSLDLSIYMTHEDVEITRSKESDLSTFRDEHEGLDSNLPEIYDDFPEKMQHLLQRQKSKYQKLFERYKNIFWEGRARLEEIYEARKLYLSASKTQTSVKSSKSHAKGTNL